MAFRRGAVYNSVSEITGPSGWYKINTAKGPVIVYVDQDYDGGGWVMVMANRRNTSGMNNLTYNDAINTVNYRTGNTANSTNITVPQGMGVKNLGITGVNAWVGLNYWGELGGRVTNGVTTVVQFVSGSAYTLGLTALHTKRYRWQFTNFTTTYAYQGVSAISDETGTGVPGLYSYASTGYNLTTYDKDQDIYGSNCSNLYNNNPWWYSNCWSGNYFAGGGYADGPYWVSSGGDNHVYGAVYIK